MISYQVPGTELSIGGIASVNGYFVPVWSPGSSREEVIKQINTILCDLKEENRIFHVPIEVHNTH